MRRILKRTPEEMARREQIDEKLKAANVTSMADIHGNGNDFCDFTHEGFPPGRYLWYNPDIRYIRIGFFLSSFYKSTASESFAAYEYKGKSFSTRGGFVYGEQGYEGTETGRAGAGRRRSERIGILCSREFKNHMYMLELRKNLRICTRIKSERP